MKMIIEIDLAETPIGVHDASKNEISEKLLAFQRKIATFTDFDYANLASGLVVDFSDYQICGSLRIGNGLDEVLMEE